MNSAFVGYEEFRGGCYPPRPFCLILNILRKPNALIANYSFKIIPSLKT